MRGVVRGARPVYYYMGNKEKFDFSRARITGIGSRRAVSATLAWPSNRATTGRLSSRFLAPGAREVRYGVREILVLSRAIRKLSLV